MSDAKKLQITCQLQAECQHHEDIAKYYGSGRWANDWPVYVRRQHDPAGEFLHCSKCGHMWLNLY